LIGFMGSGKSTVGRNLSQKIGCDFIDLDELIVKKHRLSIPEIFELYGEKQFRDWETEALYSLSGKCGLVIASGGGAPVQPENRDFFIKDAFTVYLEISFEEFLKRSGGDPGRPLLSMPQEKLKALFQARLPVYRKLGNTLTTDKKRPEEIEKDIIKLLDW
ncbi:unnamed protein product, partial [marine sediment metagenome]